MSIRFIQLCLIVMVSLALFACQKTSQQNKTDRFPWQITILDDGSSRIFGIRLGLTRVGEVKHMIGSSPKLALFENPDGRLSLELFYKEFSRAGLSGRLVLTVGAADIELQALKQSSRKKDRLDSGAVQHRLDAGAWQTIDAWPVSAMTYMPYANLDEDIIIARFGEPAEKIRSHEKAQHWLYPDKGLDLIINEAGKEILQYVAPGEFEKLTAPLRR